MYGQCALAAHVEVETWLVTTATDLSKSADVGRSHSPSQSQVLTVFKTNATTDRRKGGTTHRAERPLTTRRNLLIATIDILIRGIWAALAMLLSLIVYRTGEEQTTEFWTAVKLSKIICTTRWMTLSSRKEWNS
jgi:hypothetical protein